MQLKFNITDMIKAMPVHIAYEVEKYPELVQAQLKVEKIGLVGFCIDPKTGKFDDSDGELLNYSLQSLTENNATFSPDLTAGVINADEAYGGLDFFDVETSYDVLLFANLFMPRDIEEYKSEIEAAKASGEYQDKPFFFISPKHNKRDDPAVKSKELSAKVVFTRSRGASLSIVDFTFGDHYHLLKTDLGVNRTKPFWDIGCAMLP